MYFLNFLVQILFQFLFFLLSKIFFCAINGYLPLLCKINMFPSEDALKLCLNSLQKNQIIVIALNGIYYLATSMTDFGYQNLEKITQKSSRIEYLFKDQKQLNEFVNFPSWSSFLLQEILPNHLTCLLSKKNIETGEKRNSSQNSNENSILNNSNLSNSEQNNAKIYCNKTSHSFTQKLLDSLETPLLITKASIAGEMPAINLAMLKSYFGDNIHYFLPPKYLITGIGPTLIEISSDKLEILEVGILEKNDFASFVTGIEIVENLKVESSFSLYNQSKSIILTKNYIPKKDETVVILGTKEKIRQTFELNSLNLLNFHHKIYQNKILINLGSQTNLENVACHLTQKIFEVRSLGMKIIILDQNWGQNKWGKIINFYLQKYTETEFSTKIENKATIERIKPKIEKMTIIKKIKQSFDKLSLKNTKE